MARLSDLTERMQEVAMVQKNAREQTLPTESRRVEVTQVEADDAISRAEAAFPSSGSLNVMADFALRMSTQMKWLESCKDRVDVALHMREMEITAASCPGIKEDARLLSKQGEAALRQALRKETEVMKSLHDKLGMDYNNIFPDDWGIDIFSEENETDHIRLCHTVAQKICSNCQREAAKGESFKKCSRCLASYYCSERCQRADWESGGHSALCRRWRKLRSGDSAAQNAADTPWDVKSLEAQPSSPHL